MAVARPNAPGMQVLEACQVVRVEEFAEQLDQHYDMIVGDRGVKRWGRPRQCFSIARAILADPRLLALG